LYCDFAAKKLYLLYHFNIAFKSFRKERALDTASEWTFQSTSETETQRLGTMLAKLLEPGTVIALNGNLGAGKTRLVQAIAVALGVDREQVNSPTFVLIQEYQGSLPLYHFDTYRLQDTDEFLELGADDLLYANGVCLIEWADKVAEVLPRDLLQINIEHSSETARTFHFKGQGPRSTKIVDALK
tara:strand:+ start:2769 stop:3323 length:555 start_codon:yes stop_codon:yes gene_type:complete